MKNEFLGISCFQGFIRRGHQNIVTNRDLFSFFLTNFVGTQLIVPSATKFYQWRPTFLAVARSDWLGEIIENAIFGSTLGRGLYFSLTLLFLSPCTTLCGGPNNSSFKIQGGYSITYVKWGSPTDHSIGLGCPHKAIERLGQPRPNPFSLI